MLSSTTWWRGSILAYVLSTVFVVSGCVVGEDDSSQNAPRVRGDDVADLFTVPALPELDLGVLVRGVRCRRTGNAPGRGGRWYFWRCVVEAGAGRRDVDVMWQIADPDDASFAAVEARDVRTGRRFGDAGIERPLEAAPRDVERLFTVPARTRLHVGDGVNSARCRPGRDPSRLGNPWRCTLETDSAGTVRVTLRIRPDGRFVSRRAGRGCFVRVR